MAFLPPLRVPRRAVAMAPGEVAAVVREEAESRRGRRLRRRSSATSQPPPGPWCVLRAVGEAVPGLGQLLRVTPASWLEAPKRRRRGRRTSSLSLDLRGGEGGGDEEVGPTSGPCQLPVSQMPTTGGAGPGSPTEALGKGEFKSSMPSCCALFLLLLATPFQTSPGGGTARDTFACPIIAKSIVLNHLMKALTRFKLLIHLWGPQKSC